jgi:REP element-mobilizing transposase RayT
MELNAAGHVAAACWLAIPSHFAAVILHAQVVMPNHVHGLIDLLPSADVALTVSVIVGSFKSAVTRFTNQMGIVTPRPLWQYSFHDHHDHIVRDERSFEQIYEYVRNNPQKWHEDRLYHATDMQS